MDKFLKLRQVMSITALSKSSIYSMQKDGKFPHSVKLGASYWLAGIRH